MKKAIYERFPYWTAIVSGLICTIFTSLGAAAAQILKADEWNTYLIVAIALFVSVVLAIALVARKRAEFGFRKPERIVVSVAVFCLPLVIMEILPIALCGFRLDISLKEFMILALFTIFVGLNEEIWFRGIALKALLAKGPGRAIAITSIVFGLLHTASLLGNAEATLGGASFATTLLQIVFAFGVGIALAAITVLTKSLIIPIIWHITHDFIAISTNTRGLFGDNSELLVTAIQVVLLLISAIGFWRLATKRSSLPK